MFIFYFGNSVFFPLRYHLINRCIPRVFIICSMLRLFEAGLRYTENSDEDEFYFRDFNFYCTVIASKYGLMRIPGLTIMFSLVAFYFGSAVLFCAIMNDQNVCPSYGNNSSHHDGWLTTIYFASVTMSTVGYGDVSLYEYGQPKWITCIAIVYMLVAMAVALSVFAKVADMAMNGIGLYKVHMFSRMKTQIMESKDMPLYKQIRRLIALRVIELSIYFFALNLFGVFVARFFIARSDVEGQQWNWMTTLYWAIQTTTTIGMFLIEMRDLTIFVFVFIIERYSYSIFITGFSFFCMIPFSGYGDINQPFELRYFNIFFTSLGTAFVGNCLASLSGLTEEINDHRRYYAWKRRELSKMLIDELQVNDDKLDQ